MKPGDVVRVKPEATVRPVANAEPHSTAEVEPSSGRKPVRVRRRS